LQSNCSEIEENHHRAWFEVCLVAALKLASDKIHSVVRKEQELEPDLVEEDWKREIVADWFAFQKGTLQRTNLQN